MVEIHELTRRYGNLEALRGLNLSILPGETFGLLGPNGAGKSTTIKILATLLRPTSGTARLLGYDLVDQANDRLSPTEASRRRDPLVDAFALTDDIGRPIGGYSKGMKQKVLLIAALQHDPEILLLDEPLDGLDVAAQEHLKGILRKHTAAGRTVIYSSHILEVVERICDRVGIIHRGRLVALGTPHQLIAENGQSSFAELFLSLTG
ncbi:MAG: ABC transporter ATP-binding protein [Candidatus Eisenbacteria bacterium]|uniref:ABC transporter ATP-binding protein n=1 Tax=Eiseniibacteriota bacterium TaxID=2212470 RepID=A0A538TCC4_UNCEI|nr:MAG: ABC transporter ATP-binding protein [Candidatus Eisenbacteria bacterium]